MVVRVHEAGQDDLASEVQDLIGGGRKLRRGSDLLDDPVAREETGVGDLTARVVHGDQHASVAGEQCRQWSDLSLAASLSRKPREDGQGHDVDGHHQRGASQIAPGRRNRRTEPPREPAADPGDAVIEDEDGDDLGDEQG